MLPGSYLAEGRLASPSWEELRFLFCLSSWKEAFLSSQVEGGIKSQWVFPFCLFFIRTFVIHKECVTWCGVHTYAAHLNPISPSPPLSSSLDLPPICKNSTSLFLTIGFLGFFFLSLSIYTFGFLHISCGFCLIFMSWKLCFCTGETIKILSKES